MKYVPQLEPSIQQQLERLVKRSANHRVRQRAHAILLSARQYSIERFADIFSVHRNTISEWIDLWERQQFDSLEDAPRSGRPPRLSQADEQMLLEAIDNDPQRIGQALAELKKDGQADQPRHTVGTAAPSRV